MNLGDEERRLMDLCQWWRWRRNPLSKDCHKGRAISSGTKGKGKVNRCILDMKLKKKNRKLYGCNLIKISAASNKVWDRKLFLMLQLSRSLSQFETQDIKTQPQFNIAFHQNNNLQSRLSLWDSWDSSFYKITSLKEITLEKTMEKRNENFL